MEMLAFSDDDGLSTHTAPIMQPGKAHQAPSMRPESARRRRIIDLGKSDLRVRSSLHCCPSLATYRLPR